jgi:UPF0755 protein
MRKVIKRIIISIFFLAILASGIVAGLYYLLKTDATTLKDSKDLIIGRDDNFETVVMRLELDFGLQFPYFFKELGKKMNVHNNIRPGRFKIHPGISNHELAILLRKGGTLTVNVVIRGTQDYKKIAPYLSKVLEPDSQEFNYLLNSDSFLIKYGFDIKTIPAMFIPNTYNLYYFTSAQEVFEKLYYEYQKFWSEEKINKAKKKNLTPIQVSILASIVDKETNQVSEMPRVAGVYLNRLAVNHPLQADPTVKFAIDSPALKRVLTVHTQTAHPYNTYHINGLPPGPICIPSLQSIESVLNAEEHNYFFFCARPDFSGFHNFAVTHDEHIVNRRNYQKFLNRINIR